MKYQRSKSYLPYIVCQLPRATEHEIVKTVNAWKKRPGVVAALNNHATYSNAPLHVSVLTNVKAAASRVNLRLGDPRRMKLTLEGDTRQFGPALVVPVSQGAGQPLTGYHNALRNGTKNRYRFPDYQAHLTVAWLKPDAVIPQEDLAWLHKQPGGKSWTQGHVQLDNENNQHLLALRLRK